tara:strand:- start:9266 stop:9544 length:279 start_codon:yes stop_codon:yes gene_type:complete
MKSRIVSAWYVSAPTIGVAAVLGFMYPTYITDWNGHLMNFAIGGAVGAAANLVFEVDVSGNYTNPMVGSAMITGVTATGAGALAGIVLPLIR